MNKKMRTYGHAELTIGDCKYHISIVDSGDPEFGYTAHWFRVGSKEKVFLDYDVMSAIDAESQAMRAIREAHKTS